MIRLIILILIFPQIIFGSNLYDQDGDGSACTATVFYKTVPSNDDLYASDPYNYDHSSYYSVYYRYEIEQPIVAIAKNGYDAQLLIRDFANRNGITLDATLTEYDFEGDDNFSGYKVRHYVEPLTYKRPSEYTCENNYGEDDICIRYYFYAYEYWVVYPKDGVYPENAQDCLDAYDQDGDGVDDIELDQCPDTPYLFTVDAYGCWDGENYNGEPIDCTNIPHNAIDNGNRIIDIEGASYYAHQYLVSADNYNLTINCDAVEYEGSEGFNVDAQGIGQAVEYYLADDIPTAEDIGLETASALEISSLPVDIGSQTASAITNSTLAADIGAAITSDITTNLSLTIEGELGDYLGPSAAEIATAIHDTSLSDTNNKLDDLIDQGNESPEDLSTVAQSIIDSATEFSTNLTDAYNGVVTELEKNPAESIPDQTGTEFENIATEKWDLKGKIEEIISNNPISDAINGVVLETEGAACELEYVYSGQTIKFGFCQFQDVMNQFGQVVLMLVNLHCLLILFKR